MCKVVDDVVICDFISVDFLVQFQSKDLAKDLRKQAADRKRARVEIGDTDEVLKKRLKLLDEELEELESWTSFVIVDIEKDAFNFCYFLQIIGPEERNLFTIVRIDVLTT